MADSTNLQAANSYTLPANTEVAVVGCAVATITPFVDFMTNTGDTLHIGVDPLAIVGVTTVKLYEKSTPSDTPKLLKSTAVPAGATLSIDTTGLACYAVVITAQNVAGGVISVSASMH